MTSLMNPFSTCPNPELLKAIELCRDGVAPEKEEYPVPDYVCAEPTTASEKREWDKFSLNMERYHNYFKTTFQNVWENADKVAEQGLTLKRYLSYASELDRHLHGHHGIEEKWIFPILAKKMPAFGDSHVQEHVAIHDGLDRYGEYIKKAQSDPSLYSAEDFRKILSSFGPVLFFHMDAEVKSLRGDNLRRYYTLEELNDLSLPL